MADIPGRAIITATNLAVNLKGAHAFLALRHQVDHLKPGVQRVVRILKNRSRADREAIAISTATVGVLTHPMKGTHFQRVRLVMAAAQAPHTVRPPEILQKLLAGLLSREPLHQSGQGHRRLGRHGCSPLLEAA